MNSLRSQADNAAQAQQWYEELLIAKAAAQVLDAKTDDHFAVCVCFV